LSEAKAGVSFGIRIGASARAPVYVRPAADPSWACISVLIAGIVTAHCNGSVGDTEREELGENPLENCWRVFCWLQ